MKVSLLYCSVLLAHFVSKFDVTYSNFFSFIVAACSLSCMNGGTPNSECTVCMCPAGYTGTDCSMDIDDCASNPCGANRTGSNYTMCASKYALINSECGKRNMSLKLKISAFCAVPCADARCLTCSNGVYTCSECMIGFQVDDHTKECVAVLSISVLGEIILKHLSLTIGASFGVLLLVLVIAIIIVIAVLVYWRKNKVK